MTQYLMELNSVDITTVVEQRRNTIESSTNDVDNCVTSIIKRVQSAQILGTNIIELDYLMGVLLHTSEIMKHQLANVDHICIHQELCIFVTKISHFMKRQEVVVGVRSHAEIICFVS